MDEGRRADVAGLQKDIRTSKDPIVRKKASEALRRIGRQEGDSYLSSARKALFKATRAGDDGNRRQINEDIHRHMNRNKHKGY